MGEYKGYSGGCYSSTGGSSTLGLKVHFVGYLEPYVRGLVACVSRILALAARNTVPGLFFQRITPTPKKTPPAPRETRQIHVSDSDRFCNWAGWGG